MDKTLEHFSKESIHRMIKRTTFSQKSNQIERKKSNSNNPTVYLRLKHYEYSTALEIKKKRTKLREIPRENRQLPKSKTPPASSSSPYKKREGGREGQREREVWYLAASRCARFYSNKKLVLLFENILFSNGPKRCRGFIPTRSRY